MSGEHALRDTSADGLRGLAALNVMLCHFVAAFLPSLLRGNYGDLEQAKNPLSLVEKIIGSPVFTVLFNGNFAVLIFFVLSGYVLSSPALKNDNQKIRSRFWGRYLRLNIPVCVACILSWCALKIGLYYNLDAGVITNSKWLLQQYARDVSFKELIEIATIKGVLGEGVLIPPMWTIRVELIGSVVLLATLMLSPANRQVACIAVVSIAVLLLRTADTIYLLCFFAGCLCNWMTVSRRIALPLFLVGLILGSYQPDGVTFMLPSLTADSKTLYNAIGAVSLTIALCRGGLFARSLANPYVQYLGKVSYSIYLLHFILLCSVSSAVVVTLGAGWVGLSVAFILYVITTFSIAHFFTLTVDNSAVSLAHKFARFIEGQSRQGAVDDLATRPQRP